MLMMIPWKTDFPQVQELADGRAMGSSQAEKLDRRLETRSLFPFDAISNSWIPFVPNKSRVLVN